jgi:type I restriction enzyme S subunit
LEKILAAKNAEGAKGKGEKSHAKSAKSAKVGSCVSREEIPDGEKPFDIPESWEWVRLVDCGEFISGFTPSPKDLCGKGIIPYFKVADMNVIGNELWMQEAKLFLKSTSPKKYFFKNTIVYPKNGGAVFTNKKRILAQDSVVDLNTGGFSASRLIDLQYIYVYFTTIDFRKCYKGTALPTIDMDKLKRRLLPLPPLAEQKRIVAKIEELMPLVERYEKAWSKLKDFNKRFPADMQKSLLQMAIQGKLVEQRAEEGTGRELLEKILAAKNAKDAEKGKGKGRLTRSRGDRGDAPTSAPSASPRDEIPDDEKPFDIPDSWEWVRLGTVIDMLSGFAFKSADFKETGKYRLLRGINLSVGVTRWDDAMYVDDMPEKLNVYRIHKGDVLIGLDRPWISDGIRVAIFDEDEDAYLVQRVLRVRETIAITKEYIALLLRSNLFRNSVEGETTGISVPHISPNQVGGVPIPLPPLAEQKRIVAKIEELLPLCDRLK